MPTLRSVHYNAILENSNYIEKSKTANIHVFYLIIIMLKMSMNRKTRKRTSIRCG